MELEDIATYIIIIFFYLCIFLVSFLKLLQRLAKLSGQQGVFQGIINRNSSVSCRDDYNIMVGSFNDELPPKFWLQSILPGFSIPLRKVLKDYVCPFHFLVMSYAVNRAMMILVQFLLAYRNTFFRSNIYHDEGDRKINLLLTNPFYSISALLYYLIPSALLFSFSSFAARISRQAAGLRLMAIFLIVFTIVRTIPLDTISLIFYFHKRVLARSICDIPEYLGLTLSILIFISFVIAAFMLPRIIIQHDPFLRPHAVRMRRACVLMAAAFLLRACIVLPSIQRLMLISMGLNGTGYIACFFIIDFLPVMLLLRVVGILSILNDYLLTFLF